MTKNTWDYISDSYLATRFMPLYAGAPLLEKAISRAGQISVRPLRIKEFGCGSGRLARLLMGLSQPFNYLGLDISARMLNLAPSAVMRDPRFTLKQLDCSKLGANECGSADLVIAHWIWNATDRWCDIGASACRVVTPGGLVLWLEERGDLYDAIDGKSIGSECIDNLFLHFRSGLGEWGEVTNLRRRSGLQMGEVNAAATFLRERGFNVSKHTDMLGTWHRWLDCRWIIDNVLKKRAFSNLVQIPDAAYDRGLRYAEKFCEKYPVSTKLSARMKYWAYPITAERIK